MVGKDKGNGSGFGSIPSMESDERIEELKTHGGYVNIGMHSGSTLPGRIDSYDSKNIFLKPSVKRVPVPDFEGGHPESYRFRWEENRPVKVTRCEIASIEPAEKKDLNYIVKESGKYCDSLAKASKKHKSTVATQ